MNRFFVLLLSFGLSLSMAGCGTAPGIADGAGAQAMGETGALAPAALSDPAVRRFDENTITADLLAAAADMPDVSDEHPPRWRGVILSRGYDVRDFDLELCDLYFRKAAEFGFNTVSLMVPYQTLFEADASAVYPEMLRQLDAVVAAAIRYRIHLNLLTMTLPGRWISVDFDAYTTTGELDLFTNPARQGAACAVWELLAERYAEIPNSVLSFQPLWEAQNYDLSSGLDVTQYTPEEMAAVYVRLIEAIRERDADRFVIYEPTANNPWEAILQESAAVREAVESRFDNVQMLSNFCELAYVYAEMTASEGANIDFQNHSMFKPSYPTAIYGVQGWIIDGSPLTLTGELPEGTALEFYPEEVKDGGVLEIVGDGKTLYRESLPAGAYQTEPVLSGLYPYAKSEKQIRVSLSSNMEAVQISFSGNLTWSGMNVILPERYAVERWWFPSEYDAFLEGKETAPIELRLTSNVQLTPNGSAGAVVIHPDVTFTTDEIIMEANQETIDRWGAEISAFAPGSAVRIERAAFCIGTQYDAALAYYGDFLDMCDRYGLSWFINDMSFCELFVQQPEPLFYAGAAYTPCNDGYVLQELLELYQSHMELPD